MEPVVLPALKEDLGRTLPVEVAPMPAPGIVPALPPPFDSNLSDALPEEPAVAPEPPPAVAMVLPPPKPGATPDLPPVNTVMPPVAPPQSLAMVLPPPQPDATPDLPPEKLVVRPVSPPKPQLQIIHVQLGHTLWKLARDAYGAGRDYVLILEANRTTISNPNLIRVGQDLVVPPKKEQ